MTHNLNWYGNTQPARKISSNAPEGAEAYGPWTRERYLEEFRSLTAKMLEITTKKNNDYGGASDPFKNFRAFEELGILVRMSDKFARLRTALVEKRELQVSDESVEDTALDLANYALLLICYRRGA